MKNKISRCIYVGVRGTVLSYGMTGNTFYDDGTGYWLFCPDGFNTRFLAAKNNLFFTEDE